MTPTGRITQISSPPLAIVVYNVTPTPERERERESEERERARESY